MERLLQSIVSGAPRQLSRPACPIAGLHDWRQWVTGDLMFDSPEADIRGSSLRRDKPFFACYVIRREPCFSSKLGNPVRPLIPLTIAFAAVAAPLMTNADVPVLSGRTGASATLVADIRIGIDVFAQTWIGCSQIGSIAAGPVPDDFDPKVLPKVPATLVPPPQGRIVYELWKITGCGKSVPIVVQLWRTEAGKDEYSLIPLPKSQ
jgi:hypothetical protein